ncbi:hypothetical protein A0H81_02675 [Grifola frondosa]|uniref:F-box domain-containing protein n=1 Tax=Grifola frondosa TaxID=5627 RepID=A0A1C7MN44_GRIFR|nr:hypothetical protein A0H81_02675 [Grifola frondosa]
MGVVLDTLAKVDSFCKFMLSDANRFCFSFFRMLSLKIPAREFENTSFEPSDALIDVLGRASRLEELEIDNCEMLLSWHLWLSDALSALTTLKELMVDIGPHCPLSYDMVQDMKSALVKVSIVFGGIDYDPIRLIANFSASLEEVELHSAQLIPDDDLDRGLQFPRVQYFLMSNNHWPSVEHLVHLFPNLHSLCTGFTEHEKQLRADMYRGYRSNHSVMDDILDLREENQRYQTGEDGLTWSSLNHIRGRTADLFMLGLACAVYRVDIILVETLTRDMVPDILLDTRPSILEITFCTEDLDLDLLPDLLGSPEVAPLSHLILQCVVNVSVDMDKLKFGVLAMIEPLLITSLVLRVKWHENVNMSPMHLAIVEALDSEGGLEVLAQEIADAAPALGYFKHIFIDVWERGMRCWNVIRADYGEIQVVEISRSEGMEIMSTEGIEDMSDIYW